MSSFTSFSAPLNIQYDAEASRILGADHWRVTKGFQFYVGSPDSGEWVNVPAGYLTDGASVPRMFWSLIPPWGIYGQAAVVHDILCEYLSTTLHGLPKPISRVRCDQILLEAMIALQVPAWKRQVIYRAVCLYRRVAMVSDASSTLEKRLIESKWVG